MLICWVLTALVVLGSIHSLRIFQSFVALQVASVTFSTPPPHPDVYHCNWTVVVESTTPGPCCSCVLFGDSQIDLIITPAPDMKQVLDKPGPCGQYENYQRPEGFPVGKQS